MERIFSYLDVGGAKYTNTVHENAMFILQKQLKDKELWKKFVNVFKSKADIVDQGWRGEYFGKMMRGACLTYRYYPDEELYEIMYDTVKNLLATQDELGRIATYTVEAEYNGWDMWTRKYVLVGCLYFYLTVTAKYVGEIFTAYYVVETEIFGCTVVEVEGVQCIYFNSVEHFFISDVTVGCRSKGVVDKLFKIDVFKIAAVEVDTDTAV